MNYIRLSNQEYPIYLRVIKAENPQTSFPANPSDEQLQPYGFAGVNESAPPAYNTDIEKITEIAPTNDGLQWNQVWSIFALTQLELDTQLQRARDKKYLESEVYAESLVDAAYASPTTTTTENPSTYKRMVKARERDNANKIASRDLVTEDVLTQTEKDLAKTDQKLSEFDGKVYTANDKCYAEIDKKDLVSEVQAINVETAVTWPAWVAPV